MTRVKHGTTTRRRHNKITDMAKGYRGGRKNLFRRAKNAVAKAGMHAYVDRRKKKRVFRRLWITRINAAVRAEGWMYSRFMNALTEKKVIVDRKILADIAVHKPEVFKKVVEFAKE
ncbi:MAG: 50S ribosomal protein L20 [Patescibacteria group bacterium]|nr:50S ribosomal protein L20 [Patescibacteria group bacterium]